MFPLIPAPTTLNLAILAALIIWLLVCGAWHRRLRGLPWLAGSSVTTTVAFVGVTLAASTQCPRAFLLVPVWLAVGALGSAHVRAARRDLAKPVEAIGGVDPLLAIPTTTEERQRALLL